MRTLPHLAGRTLTTESVTKDPDRFAWLLRHQSFACRRLFFSVGISIDSRGGRRPRRLPFDGCASRQSRCLDGEEWRRFVGGVGRPRSATSRHATSPNRFRRTRRKPREHRFGTCRLAGTRTGDDARQVLESECRVEGEGALRIAALRSFDGTRWQGERCRNEGDLSGNVDPSARLLEQRVSTIAASNKRAGEHFGR